MSGFTNYLRNKLIDWYKRGIAFTPPATTYVALVTTTPTASAGGTELATTGYARQSIAQSAAAWAATNGDTLTTNPSTGTTGVTSNNAAVNFGTAPVNWGTVTHWELWDALTGGNRLEFGEIVDGSGTPAPRSIVSGDPVSFPISALRSFWS